VLLLYVQPSVFIAKSWLIHCSSCQPILTTQLSALRVTANFSEIGVTFMDAFTVGLRYLQPRSLCGLEAGQSARVIITDDGRTVSTDELKTFASIFAANGVLAELLWTAQAIYDTWSDPAALSVCGTRGHV